MSGPQDPAAAPAAPPADALSRRSLLKLGSAGAAALGVGPLLAACGGGGSGSSGGKTTVRLWTWYTEDAKEFPRLISAFEAKHPNITVKSRIFGTPDQFLPALAAAVSGGDPPEIFAPHVRALSYGKAGVSADLKSELGASFLSDFFKSANDEYTLDGKQYAIGWEAQMFGLFYNPDLLNQAGVDPEGIETWDDLIAAAPKISVIGKAPVGVSANPGTSGLDFFLPLLAQVSDDPTYFLRLDRLAGEKWTDPTVVKALQLMQRIVKGGVFQKGVNGTSGDQVAQLFYTGGSAMLFNGSWTPSTLANDAPADFVAKYKVMQTPAISAGAKHYSANQAGAGLAVSETSKAKDAALTFLKFMYSPDQYIQTMNNSNSMPCTNAAAEKITNPTVKLMASWLIGGLGVPHIPFGDGSSAAGGPLASIWDGSGDPTSVAKQIQQAVLNAKG